MGRRRKRRGRQSLDERRHINLIDRYRLEEIWQDGVCDHSEPIISAYGLCANLTCTKCGTSMQFILKFGYPKTFELTIDGQFVGYSLTSDVREFMGTKKFQLVMPEDGADPEGGAPLRDQTMLMLLMNELLVIDNDHDMYQHTPMKDFAKMWNKIPCQHETGYCQIQNDMITLECTDCASTITFTHRYDDKFQTYVTRLPLGGTDCGLHSADKVVNFLLKSAEVLELPNVLADPMSDDPDRDAHNIVKIILLLESHGLLKRVDDRPYGWLVKNLSAMVCSREEFNTLAPPIIDKIRMNNIKCSDGERRISERHAVEHAYLSWPYSFEGLGIQVDYYDIVGVSLNCVKCGFSTLDDPNADESYWSRGCPECGYIGYLLDVDSVQNST